MMPQDIIVPTKAQLSASQTAALGSDGFLVVSEGGKTGSAKTGMQYAGARSAPYVTINETQLASKSASLAGKSYADGAKVQIGVYRNACPSTGGHRELRISSGITGNQRRDATASKQKAALASTPSSAPNKTPSERREDALGAFRFRKLNT
jgi:hypothetical protein